MALVIPSSMQDMIGRAITRVAVSYERNLFFFDVEKKSTITRWRFAYEVNGTFDRIVGLSSLTGHEPLSFTGLDREANGQTKLLIRTNGQDRVCLIYFSGYNEEEPLMTEAEVDFEEEEGELLLYTEESGVISDAIITDIVVGKQPPYVYDPVDKIQYIVLETDMDFTIEDRDHDA